MRIASWITAVVLVVGLGAAGQASAASGPETQVSWYGFTKFDLSWDSAQSSHGNFAMWVKDYRKDHNKALTSVTARQTRLGLNLKREDIKGKVEFDFYGTGAENKAHIQMRKAYVDFPLGNFMVRAGQDADLFSPLVPATLNYTVCWGVGNVGYRRPQIRLYQKTESLYWGVAVARNITPDLNGDNIVDGDAGTPVVEGRVDVSVPAGDMDLTVGVSGHYGYMNSPGAADDDYDTWSVNGSMSLQISPKVKLLGEGYVGSNMATYFGSILNRDTTDGLTSAGGWANLQIAPSSDVQISLGGGLDTVDKDDLTGSGARDNNYVVFGNVQRVIASGVKAGMEVSYWQTKYPFAEPGMEDEASDVRLQFSLKGDL